MEKIGPVEERESIFSLHDNIFILLMTTLDMYIFGGVRIFHPKKKKQLTKEEIDTLNWGEIEKRLGIDSSKEPPKRIKMKIIHDSIFARECHWFSKDDIEEWKHKGDKILKEYNSIIKSH